MNHKRIWISWSYHRRSFELSRAFSAKYEYFENALSTRVKRYFIGIPLTIKLIHKERPDWLFVQNPSLFLVLLAVMLKPVYKYNLINDLHTPYITLNRIMTLIFWRLQHFCINQADITIVTNNFFKTELGKDRIHVLPDKIPNIIPGQALDLEGIINILFICTFAEDEPVAEVIKAAQLIEKEYVIYFTGNYSNSGWTQSAMPSNIRLLGYIAEKEYECMLGSVDIVMTLTSQANCLVCGAYEGLAAAKPLILSDHKALREYFSAGSVFVENHSDSIASGIANAICDLPVLQSEIADLRTRLDIDFKSKFDSIENALIK